MVHSGYNEKSYVYRQAPATIPGEKSKLAPHLRCFVKQFIQLMLGTITHR